MLYGYIYIIHLNKNIRKDLKKSNKLNRIKQRRVVCKAASRTLEFKVLNPCALLYVLCMLALFSLISSVLRQTLFIHSLLLLFYYNILRWIFFRFLSSFYFKLFLNLFYNRKCSSVHRCASIQRLEDYYVHSFILLYERAMCTQLYSIELHVLYVFLCIYH